MLSPIQTKGHRLLRVEFNSTDQPPDPTSEEYKNSAYSVKFTMSHQKVQNYWMVRLNVDFGPEGKSTVPYRGFVEFEGMFEVSPQFDDAKVENLVKMNGGAILYGAAREELINLSSRSRYGPFELPTIDARMFIAPRDPKTAVEGENPVRELSAASD